MRIRRQPMLLASALAVSLLALAFPSATVACSCHSSAQPMHEAAADASVSVFAGVAGPLQAFGVPIQITRWFQGAVPPGGVAVLDPQPFGADGAGCGTNPPTFGREWVFVAGRNDVGRFVVGLCSTYGEADTDYGRELLAEAVAVFGPGVRPPPVAASPVAASPTPVASPRPVAASPAGPTAPAGEPSGLVATVVPVAVAILFASGLVAGMLVIMGRRRPG